MRESLEEVSWSRASLLHPSSSTAYLLILISTITIMHDWIDIAIIFAISSTMASKVAGIRRTIEFLIIFLPMSVGLGLFAFIVSGAKNIGQLLLVLFRVETAVAGSVLYAYSSDSWELADTLRKIGLPIIVAYTIALAYNMLQGMLRDLNEILQSLKSRGLIKTPLHVVPRLPLIFYILIQLAAKKAEDLQVALEARRFNPNSRRSSRKINVRMWDLAPPLVAFLSILLVSFT